MSELRDVLIPGRPAAGLRDTRLARYGLTLGTVAAALLLTQALAPLGNAAPATLFFTAVVLSAWYGGPGPGALAVALSALALVSFWPRAGSSGQTWGGIVPMAAVLSGALLTNLVDTFRRRDQEALRGSEAQYRLLFEGNPHPMWVFDRETLRFLAVNETAIDRYGYSRDEFLAMTIADIRAPEAAAGDAEAAGRRHRTKDGRLVDVEITAHPVTFAGREAVLVLATDVTEQRRAESARRESENRLQLALDAAQMGAWEWDVAVGAVEWSSRLAALHGLGQGTRGGTLDEFLAPVHRDDRGLVRRSMERAAEAGSDYSFEFRVVLPGGDVRWIEGRGRVLRGEAGGARMLGLSLDITERKRAALEFQQSNQRFELAAAAVSSAIYEWDLERDAVIWSRGLNDLLGFRPREVELTGEWWLARVHEDDAPRVRRDVAAALESDSTFTVEYRIRNREGEYLHVWDRGIVVRDDRGLATRVVGSRQDITERKRSEEALRDSEMWLRTVFEGAATGIGVVDMRGQFVETNPALQQMLGYTAGELTRLRFTDVTPAAELAGESEWLRELAGGEGEAHQVEKRFVRKDGSLVWGSLTASLIRGDDGEPRFGICLVEDMTERRRLEEQLWQSQRMEAVGRLAGGIAHDFNNLLTAITGHSAFLMKRLKPGDTLRWHSEGIRKAADRAATLTRQLLAFSRKQVLQPEVLNLNVVVDDMYKMLQRLIGEDIELLTSSEPDLGRVRADPGQLEQVIMNLVINARDAMPGGGTLVIETRNVDLDEAYASRHVAVTPGPYVMVAVSDTGHGMDEETQARIFEPFFTTKEAGKGTGLGLSTVYGIVKQSGGNVWVYSEVGEGTTFKVYLPLADGEVVRRPAQPPASQARGWETILLVEDDDLVRETAREILEMSGYHVLEARQGAEAVAICERYDKPIHLMITDVVMPQMGGRELAERLADARPDTRVLYISGYTEDAIVHHGVLGEKVSFLSKPFTPDALIRKVRGILDAAGAQA
jgi:PAS domain S-box-containing protein